MRIAYQIFRFLLLSILSPKKMKFELEQADFWFTEAKRAFQLGEGARSRDELRMAKAQFKIAERRFMAHLKHIAP